MYCETLRRVGDMFDIYASSDEPCTIYVKDVDGGIIDTHMLTEGDLTIRIGLDESVEMVGKDSKHNYVTFRPGDGHPSMTAEDLRKADNIRRAAEAKVPGIHIGL